MQIPTTLRIEISTKEKLEEIADKERRSLNNLINYILDKYIEQNSPIKENDNKKNN